MNLRTRESVIYEFLLGDAHKILDRLEQLNCTLIGNPDSQLPEDLGLVLQVNSLLDYACEVMRALLHEDGSVALTLHRMQQIQGSLDGLSDRLPQLLEDVEVACVRRGELKSMLVEQDKMLRSICGLMHELEKRSAQRQAEIRDKLRKPSWWERYGIQTTLNAAVVFILLLLFKLSIIDVLI